jgi:hypothetical protein
MEGSEMSKVIKNVRAASVSRVISAAGFKNGKGLKGWQNQNTFEVCQGGWNSKDFAYAQVFFEKAGISNHVEIFEIAKVLRAGGYHVEVIQGEAVHYGVAYASYWLNVLVENRAVTEAKKEVEKAQYVLNKAQEKLAEVMAEVEAAVA